MFTLPTKKCPPLVPPPQLRIRLMVPRREVVWQLATTMAPLSITYIAKNVSYLCIQTTAAGLDTLKLAAHQATFSGGWRAGEPTRPWSPQLQPSGPGGHVTPSGVTFPSPASLARRLPQR